MTNQEKINKKLQIIAKEGIEGSFNLQKKVFEKDNKTKNIFKKVLKLANF
ncbi:MAG: hypothetical protein PHZ26_02305 [Candidatus Gracilibacteria bacterium]|nr:hypothetical protein [Candidatus Gracilibacteria bacterium]MDD2908567.1 hypothetical protein [Candidatus Gracilibacteria bacterium]